MSDQQRSVGLVPQRRGRPGNGRERLIEAACALFGEQGFDTVGMKELAKSAGLTIGAIYHHFDSKELIYQAALETAVGRLPHAPTVEAEAMPPRQGLEALVAWFSNALLREPLLRQELLSPHLKKPLTSLPEFKGPMETFHRLLPLGAPESDPAMTLVAIVSLSFGLTSLKGIPGAAELPSDPGQLAQMVTRYVID